MKAWVSPATLDIIQERKSYRFHITHAKPTGAHLSFVRMFAGKFKAASRAARISLRNDHKENIFAKSMEAQQAREDVDCRKFSQIKKSLAPKSSYSSTYMHGPDGICVY